MHWQLLTGKLLSPPAPRACPPARCSGCASTSFPPCVRSSWGPGAERAAQLAIFHEVRSDTPGRREKLKKAIDEIAEKYPLLIEIKKLHCISLIKLRIGALVVHKLKNLHSINASEPPECTTHHRNSTTARPRGQRTVASGATGVNGFGFLRFSKKKN